MTTEEARREARKRWGSVARIESRGPNGYVVGTVGALPDEVAYGWGTTWEEAFLAADRRGAVGWGRRPGGDDE